jgi:hypothetical protein
MAALLGAVFSWRTRRGMMFAAAGSFLLSGVVFVALFNIDPHGIGAQLVSRFHALPVLMLGPLVAAGLDAVFARLGRRALTGVAIATVAIGGLNATTIVDQNRGVINAYLHDTLKPLPPDAIVFATGDHRTFGAAYAQQVEGIRDDVDWVDGRLLAYDWYVERAERRLGVPLPRTDEQGIPIMETVEIALRTGRPVFVANRFVEGFDRFASYPIGTVLRLLPPGSRVPAPHVLATRNAKVFSEFELDVALRDVANPWEREVFEYYRRPWNSLAGAFEHLGQEESARQARRAERRFSEKSR